MNQLAKLVPAPIRYAYIFIWDVWNRGAAERVGLIAAGVAFWGVFGLFPALTALIALFGLLADPMVVQNQLILAHDFLPPGAYELVADQVTRLVEPGPRTLGWATIVSTGVALWSARAGVGALAEGLNAVQGTGSRNGFVHIMVAMLMTIAMVGITMVGLLVTILVPIIVLIFQPPGNVATLLEFMRWVVMLTSVLIALGLLYRYGPSRRRGLRFSWITPGSVIVLVLWLGVSYLFSLYVGNFGNYNEVYGSIGAVIALMMWLYISAFLVLLGGALNAEIAARRGAAVI
ncbi:YihY/virulence factor BrkB family protein [Ketogulonicigenium vulgare]|uniref:Ribonuclease BN-like protein family protein n=1 Tax=Ketogulonicigenium vulgare (strain WSH-001) TaxID=759362 RepID=F9Y7D7_KETVW|nr:YihY/virulence factor BrkB family protein [Ketogulonicigenium vulgare]ADO42878.1 ribonuclease BN [Ketogulonicigenium vulgare Y25]AEM41065.1 Ribonuclease BN-like protein family protein [Ketogulonicigenium vulgare WSH-001]ALJ81210.1 ribonuclease BN [Ketogulonicigenium vulgare]AOZ54791.1 ribonuclease BN [Ketogulonicigenium vulgare]